MELSKREKKIARELIEKGLYEELKRGMSSFDAILQQWKAEAGDVKEYYYQIFGAVKDFDKQIAWRYDGLRNSRYIDTIASQIIDKLYDQSELDEFSQEIKEAILHMTNRQL